MFHRRSTRQLMPLSFSLATLLPRRSVVVFNCLLAGKISKKRFREFACKKAHSSLTAWATGVSNPIRYTTLPRRGVSQTLGWCLRRWHSHPYTSILPVLGLFSNPMIPLKFKRFQEKLRPVEETS
jgi:hypothetical protein